MKYSILDLKCCVGMTCFYTKMKINGNWNYSGKIEEIWDGPRTFGVYILDEAGRLGSASIGEIKRIPLYDQLRDKPLFKLLKLA